MFAKNNGENKHFFQFEPIAVAQKANVLQITTKSQGPDLWP